MGRNDSPRSETPLLPKSKLLTSQKDDMIQRPALLIKALAGTLDPTRHGPIVHLAFQTW